MEEHPLKTEEDLVYEMALALMDTLEAIATGKEKNSPPPHFIAAMMGPLFIKTDE